MKVLKAIRVVVVFVAGAYAAFCGVWFSVLWLGTTWRYSPESSSGGNGGIFYLALGLMLAVLAAPICGALSTVLVERLIESLVKKRTP